MNNIYKFKQWYLITNGTNDFKILLSRAQYNELSYFFPVQRVKKSLFELVEYPEVTISDVYEFLGDVCKEMEL